MEENSAELNEIKPDNNPELTMYSVFYLNQIRKWTMFFSVLGFIFVAFLILFSLFIGKILSSRMPGGASTSIFNYIGVIYFIIATIYIFPIIYLYKFSMHSKKAILNKDSQQYEMAFKNLNLHYRFVGIITIIFLSIYLLIGICVFFVKMMMR